MSAIENRAAIILKNEELFAKALATKIIDKPKLNVWMILVPIIFLYYFYRMKRYSEGKEGFTAQYIISRKQALSKATAFVSGDRDSHIDEIISKVELDEPARKCFREVLSVLFDHYVRLLTRGGESYDELVRKSYKTLDAYMEYIKHINRAEDALNRCFIDASAQDDTDDVINSIAEHSERMRLEAARKIFSQVP